MANALVDGLSVPDYILLDTTNTGSITNANMTTATVTNAYLGTAACSGTKVSAEYPVSYTGSPAYGGTAQQFGVGTIGAGSNVWVSYGRPFAAAPASVVVTNTKSFGGLQVGSIGAGSFYCAGETAADTFNWIACGSGRI